MTANEIWLNAVQKMRWLCGLDFCIEFKPMLCDEIFADLKTKTLTI